MSNVIHVMRVWCGVIGCDVMRCDVMWSDMAGYDDAMGWNWMGWDVLWCDAMWLRDVVSWEMMCCELRRASGTAKPFRRPSFECTTMYWEFYSVLQSTRTPNYKIVTTYYTEYYYCVPQSTIPHCKVLFRTTPYYYIIQSTLLRAMTKYYYVYCKVLLHPQRITTYYLKCYSIQRITPYYKVQLSTTKYYYVL